MIKTLNSILKEEEIDTVTEGEIEIICNIEQDQKGVRAAIESFAPDVGWLCLTDEVIITGKDFKVSSIEGRIILSGEFASGDKSLHIRQSGRAWDIYEMTAKKEGGCIVAEKTFVSVIRPLKLRYETYWREQENSYSQKVFVPYASRFAGFEKGGE